MVLKIAIQMDALSSINPRTDSTLLLGLEAQRRGHTLYYYTPDMLSLLNGKVIARGHRVKLHADYKHYYDLGKETTLTLSDMNVVLLRQDPPFDMEYITTTYLLERLMPKTLVVNHPAAVRNHPEKLFPALFAKFTPPTLITSDIAAITDFRKAHKDIVIKPLYGFGGHGVSLVKKNASRLPALVKRGEVVVVQPFLPEVKTGERRIILINGKIEGVMGRIPAKGEIRANLRVGGTAVKATLTKRQKEVCAAVGPELKKRGLLLVGLDMIGDYLIEINHTSPTGLAAINKLYGTKLERKVWDAIELNLES